ncbi:MAG: hypothetical protein Q8L04_04260 [Ignavibacteria bacterium]|nr:hypothetical protein [Ignavibacteria bacterium]
MAINISIGSKMQTNFVQLNSVSLTFLVLFFSFFVTNPLHSQISKTDSPTSNTQIVIVSDTSKISNDIENNSIESAGNPLAQYFPNDASYFYEPYPMKKGSSIFQIGGSFSLLPIPLWEQEFTIPALDIQYKYGLTQNLCLVASLSTILHYSNLLHSGIQWNVSTERLSFGVANHIGIASGYLSDELFDYAWALGAFTMPIIRIGYKFNHFSLTLSFVTTYAFKTYSETHSIEGKVGSDGEFNDFYCTVTMEQPFLKKQHVAIGFSLAYARTHYQSWMLYNTVNEWLFVPEFFFSVQL